MSFLKVRFAIAILLLALLDAGCASNPPSQTALMEKIGDMEVTRRELETLMYDFGYSYAVQVDVLANEIYKSSMDPEIRRRVVEWNTICVAEMFKNSFNHEPMVGLIKSWVFAIQVREFYETGYGKDFFGPYQKRVVILSREVESDIVRLAYAVMPQDATDTIAIRVYAAAENYPITNDRYATEGLSPGLARAMGAEVAGGLDAVGAINEQVIAMVDRTNLYAAYSPRQIQWQTAAMLSQSQGMIADVRDSTIAVIRREASTEFGPFIEFMAEQRMLITRDLASEREVILKAIAGERAELFSYLADERMEVFKAIAQERNEVLEEMNALSLAALEKTVHQSQIVAEAGIDRIFHHTIQIMLVPFALLTIFVVVVMIWARNTIERLLKMHEDRGDVN